MFGKSAKDLAGPVSKSLERGNGINLGFGAHEGLQMGRLSPRKLGGTTLTSLVGDYARLVDGLQAELSHINKASSKSLAD